MLSFDTITDFLGLFVYLFTKPKPQENFVLFPREESRTQALDGWGRLGALSHRSVRAM